jgi:hypothetical protein
MGKVVGLEDQLMAFFALLLQPRDFLLGSLPGLGQLLQLSLQHHGGVASVLQGLVHLSRCVSFSGLESFGMVKTQLDKLGLELLVAGLLGAQLFLMLLDQLLLLPYNPEMKV